MTEVNNPTPNENDDENATIEIERQFFTPEEIEANGAAIVALIDKINSDPDLQYVGVNFETDELPSGFGLLVLPISTRLSEGKGNKLIGVGVIPMPTFDYIASQEAGAEFIRNSVIDTLAAKVANGLRPKGEETKMGDSYPKTFEEFITNRRGGAPGEMKAFNTFAPDYVKALRKSKLPIDKAKLRMVLASKLAAENEFPKINQRIWESLIDDMIERAKAKKFDTTMLVAWREKRDEAEIDIRDTLDMDELEGLIAGIGGDE